jgi:hypothetical protein
MVGTIAPLVKVARVQWVGALVVQAMGSTVAAAAVGGVVGWAGGLWTEPRQLVSTAVAGAVLAALAGLADVSGLRVPSSKRSVPKSWFDRWGTLRSSALYGSILGLGLSTVVPFASYYWLLAFAFLVGTGGYGALLLGAYGLGRTVSVLLLTPVMVRSTDTLQVALWLHEQRGTFAMAVGLALLAWSAAAVAMMV